MNWSDHLTSLYRSLRPPSGLPPGVGVLYPQEDPAVMEVVERFLRRYYADENERTLLMGINPGRFGAGITGINFTAARQLTGVLGLEHPFGNGSELSAEFIYRVIDAAGGPDAFYSRFFIGSVSPLGYTYGGKNLNYYDRRDLQEAVEPFILRCTERLLQAPVRRDRCLCIGEDKNFKYLSGLNARFGWFREIVPLPHPRFVMQYRRKSVDLFVDRYLDAMS